MARSKRQEAAFKRNQMLGQLCMIRTMLGNILSSGLIDDCDIETLSTARKEVSFTLATWDKHYAKKNVK